MGLLHRPSLSAMFLTIFLFGGQGPDEWGMPHKGLQMAVYAVKPSYRVDEPVVIDVGIRNTTKATIWLGDNFTTLRVPAHLALRGSHSPASLPSPG